MAAFYIAAYSLDVVWLYLAGLAVGALVSYLSLRNIDFD